MASSLKYALQNPQSQLRLLEIGVVSSSS